MRSNTPRLATWLLNRFTSRGNDENVAGDIAERYQNGHSSLWYWRQVLAAIAVSLVRELRTHFFVTGRAVLVGWGLLLISIQLQSMLVPLLSGEHRPRPLLHLTVMQGWTYFGGWGSSIPGGFYVPIGPILLSWALAFPLGWIIGRLYRAQGVALFLASWLLQQTYLFAGGVDPLQAALGMPSVSWSTPAWKFLMMSANGSSVVLLSCIVILIVIPLSPFIAMFITLAGGLLSSPVSQPQPGRGAA